MQKRKKKIKRSFIKGIKVPFTMILAFFCWLALESDIQWVEVPSISRKETPVSVKKIRQPDVRQKEKKVALIIDDIGHCSDSLQTVLAIDAPITLAILPHCPCTQEAAERAFQAGKECILHLPMEPKGYPETDPGKGALLLSMSPTQIMMQLADNINAVPFIAGVNNHMGSGFMENEKYLERVLCFLKEKKLYFLDSVTTPYSKGEAIARRIGLRFIKRDIFIDNNCSFAETYGILKNIVTKRETWKALVLIGHPHESTFEAIQAILPLYETHAIKIVPASQLLNHRNGI